MKREIDSIVKKMEAEPGTATYTFYRIFIGRKAGEAEEEAENLVHTINDFGSGVGIANFSEVYHNEYNGISTVYSTFQIHHSQDGILIKVAALFSFAASVKLRLANQTFMPE